MRLIDADALLKVLRHRVKGNEDSGIVAGANATLEIVEDLVSSIPVVDAVPVVHGRWMEFNTMMTCSACDKDWYYDDNNCDEFNYCPNCGAKMDL